jgi:hypothetical protein
LSGEHLVLSGAALEMISAAPAQEPIPPVPAEQSVEIGAAYEPIVSLVSLETVVATIADHPVVAVEAAGAEGPSESSSGPEAAGGREQIVARAPGTTDPADTSVGHVPVPVAVEGDSA